MILYYYTTELRARTIRSRDRIANRGTMITTIVAAMNCMDMVRTEMGSHNVDMATMVRLRPHDALHVCQIGNMAKALS